MNYFLSIPDLNELHEKTLILCCEERANIMYSIPGSYLFVIPDDNTSFISKIRRVPFNPSGKIICYDKGDLVSAGKVFWGLRAAGFEEVFIMMGGVYLFNDLGFEVSTEPLKEVELEDYNYLPFNNSILSVPSKNDKKAHAQKIRIDEVFPVSTPRGLLLDKETLKNLIDDCGIKYKSGKSLMIYGNYAVVLACVLEYLGEKHVSIVFDNKKIKDLSDESSENPSMFSVSEASPHYTSTGTLPVQARKGSTRKSGLICSKCIIT